MNEVLRQPFDIETHKKTFTNYLEVVILEDGTIEYAVPSHQEKLIAIARKKLGGLSRDELNDLCPPAFYFDFMYWLCEVTGCVSLWNDRMEGYANEKQKKVIERLIEENLYKGMINMGENWFEIDGAIMTNVDEDTFNNEFLKWVTSKGWNFAGVIKPAEEDEE